MCAIKSILCKQVELKIQVNNQKLSQKNYMFADKIYSLHWKIDHIALLNKKILGSAE